MVLAFLLGITAARVKSDLKFPDSLYQSLTIDHLSRVLADAGLIHDEELTSVS